MKEKDPNQPAPLYLIPSLLADTEPWEVLPLSIKKVVDLIDHYIVENEKSARLFIRSVMPGKSQLSLRLQIYNQYTDPRLTEGLITPCLEGNPMGLIVEGGVPAIADPGAEVVQFAHSKGVRVIPLTGPSAIFMALMASGLYGHAFSFTGYLPIDRGPRKRRIKVLEKRALEGDTQIFMETALRNEVLLEDLLAACEDDTLLCVACDITSHNEFIQTHPIAFWRKNHPPVERRPCIFILGVAEDGDVDRLAID